ncbi:interferon-inducible GTPase-domain-containing protein [Suillus occidentalis]|nr:interferon-inducible GTPase-domain-containing protein [Suillus occidentalis]
MAIWSKNRATEASLQERVEDAEGTLRAAENRAKRAQKDLKEQERVMVEDAHRAEEARLAIERKWFEGVRPECRPSDEDIARMKAQYNYSPGFIHIAVVGSAGAGKSSFINAVRGLSKNDPGAAPTGIVETTATVTRYADPYQESRIIWYDVPGAGTAKVSDWQYFNDMGLYIFDCIIMLIDNRVLESDLAILRTCEQFKNIDAFIVRSKSDQQINNMVYEKMPQGFNPERHRFIDDTYQNVKMHLERGNLVPRRVYVICVDAMLAIVRNICSSKAIDEVDLLNDVERCACTHTLLAPCQIVSVVFPAGSSAARHIHTSTIHTECRPSEEDITRMKSQYHYSPGFIHIAVVGSAGAGKSSFINAVRGLSKNDPGAAPTGIVETTATVTRYADPHKDSCMVWYDVPGSGTPNVPDWQYFNDKGLYIFDCIIVLTDNRVLESDLAILRACEQFKNIDAFILRSKSDQHINNMACEKMPQGFDPCDPDMDAETRSHFLLTKLEERQRFIEETSQNVEMHLERGKLLPKKVYVICMDAMVATMRQIRSSKAIDEADLLSDVRGCVLRRLQSGW